MFPWTTLAHILVNSETLRHGRSQRSPDPDRRRRARERPAPRAFAAADRLSQPRHDDGSSSGPRSLRRAPYRPDPARSDDAAPRRGRRDGRAGDPRGGLRADPGADRGRDDGGQAARPGRGREGLPDQAVRPDRGAPADQEPPGHPVLVPRARAAEPLAGGDRRRTDPTAAAEREGGDDGLTAGRCGPRAQQSAGGADRARSPAARRRQGESLASRAEKIQAAADRCARIVKNFLALARQRPPERGAVSVNMVIQGALEMLAYELRTDSVEVTCEFAAGLPPLWADSHQLHQVMVNLIANAHHARRKQPKPAPRRIRLASQLDREHERVRLTVADTGPGIALEIREKIFEPFFTTKPAGEGTGLGLSLCRGIIEEHGGTIAIQSEPGQGATFVIELPLVERPTAEAAGPAAETLPLVGARRVLSSTTRWRSPTCSRKSSRRVGTRSTWRSTAPRAWTCFVTDGTTSF